MSELKNHTGPAGKNDAGRAALRPKRKLLKKVASPKEARQGAQKKGPTTAENLEKRFERGENVLDYFDLARGKMHFPK